MARIIGECLFLCGEERDIVIVQVKHTHTNSRRPNGGGRRRLHVDAHLQKTAHVCHAKESKEALSSLIARNCVHTQ